MPSRSRFLARSWLLLVICALILSPFSVPPAPARAESSALPPVILLHGMMGSNLNNYPSSSFWCWLRPRGEVWLNLLGLINPITYNDGFRTLLLQEDGITPQNGCDSIRAESLVMLVYQPVVDGFARAGFTVLPYAYDWRLDIDVSVSRLDAYIRSLGEPKVILAAHSMGGLVARRYTSDPVRAARVDRVISVGTPYWGAPVLAKHIRAGTTTLPYDILVDNDLVRQAVRNFPGAMQVLPGEAYFTQGEGYYIAGSTFLSTYTATTDFFVRGGQNGTLLANARTFHRLTDDFRSSVYTPYYVLAASHLPTVTRVREYSCWWFFTCWEENRYAPGDGTVPWASASLVGRQGDWSGTARVCHYPSGSIDLGHGAMMQDPKVMEDMVRLMRGLAPVNCRFSDPAAPDTTTANLEDLIQIRVIGEARLSVTDAQGRLTGFDAAGNIQRQIPGAILDLSQVHAILTLPASGAYNIAVLQAGPHPAQVHVTRFTAGAEGEYAPTQQVAFLDVPFAPGEAALIQAPSDAQLNTLELVIQAPGQAPLRRAAASRVLQAEELEDFTPPRTLIRASGEQSIPGFFTGQVTISLDAFDFGVGVFRTYYSLDRGQTWQEYQGPFMVEASEVGSVQARSMDLRGNQEMDWPAQSVGGEKVFLPVMIAP
jgi:pimeloyl-ACP methyl ester carboxylesterase